MKIAAQDYAQFTNYRPATVNKPEAAGIFSRMREAFRSLRKEVAPARTTEQGASAAASVIMYAPQLVSQVFERQSYIEDSHLAWKEDPLTRKSIDMFVYEATRGGVTIKVEGEKRRDKRAQEIANNLTKEILKPTTLEKWARKLLIEGDLFIQAILSMDPDSEEAVYAPPGTLVKVKAMAGAGMQRLTDDADEFIDPAKAFAQVDVASQATIEEFSEGTMIHIRWCHEDGERYGTPELLPNLRYRRMLRSMHESIVLKRMGRATRFLHYKVGDKDNPGQDGDIDKIKGEMGYINGKRDPWNSMEALRELFTNYQVSIDEVGADATLDNVKDFEMILDLYGNTLPTPLPIMGVLANKVNRDVVEDQRAQWLTRTRGINEALDEVVRFVFELALLTEDILPETITWSPIWSTSSIESASSRIQSIIALHETALMSQETAIYLLREYTGIVDIPKELERIKKEKAEEMKEEQETGAKMQKPAKAKIPAAQGALPPEQSRKDDRELLKIYG